MSRKVLIFAIFPGTSSVALANLNEHNPRGIAMGFCSASILMNYMDVSIDINAGDLFRANSMHNL